MFYPEVYFLTSSGSTEHDAVEQRLTISSFSHVEPNTARVMKNMNMNIHQTGFFTCSSRRTNKLIRFEQPEQEAEWRSVTTTSNGHKNLFDGFKQHVCLLMIC